MRSATFGFILVALIAMFGFAPASSAQVSPKAQLDAARVEPAKVQAFLATLQDALEMENHLRVASLVRYPLDAWADGQTLRVRNDSELLAHYRQIFDPSLRRAIAEARADALSITADGVTIDGGRLCLKAGEKNAALKIVKIGEPVAPR